MRVRTVALSKRKVCMVAASGIALAASAVSAFGAEVSREALLNMLRASESSYTNVEFKGSSRDLPRDSRGSRGAREELPETTVRCRLAHPAGGRFYLESRGRVLTISEGGSTGVALTGNWIAYDGNIGTRLNFVSSGGDLQPSVGVVSRHRNSGDMLLRAKHRFLECFAPFFHDKGLVSILESSKSWKIVSQDGTKVHVSVPKVEILPLQHYKESDVTTVLVLDLSRGAHIVSNQEWLNYETDQRFMFRELKVDLGRDQGAWVPKSATELAPVGPRTGDTPGLVPICEITFKSFKANLDLDEDAFVLDFPPGLKVIDVETGVQYRAGLKGKGRQSLLDGAVDALLQASGKARPRTRAAALGTTTQTGEQDSATAAGQTREADPSHGLRWWWIAAIAAVVLAGWAVWRRAGGATNVAILCLALGLPCFARPTSSASTKPFYETTHGKATVLIEQCALTAVEIVLRRYEIGYDVRMVKKRLACTQEGASLLNLRRPEEGVRMIFPLPSGPVVELRRCATCNRSSPPRNSS